MNTIAIVLFAIACASAAPRYDHRYHHHHHHQPYQHDHDMNLEQFMESQIFDTRRFWDELKREMMGLDAMIADLCKHFPTSLSDEKVEGNEYKIRINLPGYVEKEIAVKARKGLLIVQAVHNASDEPQRNYLDVRTLPDTVDVAGSWTYENGVLTIIFPLESKVKEEPIPTEVPVTQAPVHSREEMDTGSTGTDDQDVDVGADREDVDVGADRGDLGKDKSISTNEIPQGQQSVVEATTYAVDLKGEVELVPVKY